MIRDRQALDRLCERLDSVAAINEGHRESFLFYRKVLDILMNARGRFTRGPRSLTEEAAKLRLEEGFPLMDRLKTAVDLDPAVEAHEALLSLVAGEGRLAPEAVEAVREAASARGIPDILLASLKAGEIKSPKEIPLPDDARELWLFLLHNALRPVYEIHALAYERLSAFSIWDRGSCPVCGGLPAIGELRGEEGQRFLLCHRCGFSWHFRRVRCPFCDNTDHEKLRYITSEEEPSFRIDVCDACKGYLKTVNGRKGEAEFILDAEDLVTPHLDLIAEREGYEKKSPNVLGLYR